MVFPNIVLIRCSDIIVDRLWHIYTAIVEKGWYYIPWKAFTTIVLRKPGKPRYDIPKAYLAHSAPQYTIKGHDIYYGRTTDILLREIPTLTVSQHYGGCLARTTSDAIHALIYKIKDAWRNVTPR
jgi:hypothetical protein